MKITFPYMGTTIVYKKLLELLGHEVIMPPKPTQKTIDLGVKYSPEFACFPLKVITGSYIEAIEKGADTIVTSGGHGPCRAGFYGELHRRILKNMGYEVDIIVIDSLSKDFWGVLKGIKKLKGKNSLMALIKHVKYVYEMIHVLDALEIQLQKKRAYEINKGQSTRVWEDIQGLFDRAYDREQLKKAKEVAQGLIDGIKTYPASEANRIRVGVVGEIYVVMEQSINMKIEEVLGNLGVEVERSQYLSHWVEHNMVPKLLKQSHREDEILKKGEEYVKINIGGHAKQTVGHIVDYGDQGYDGVVQLMPFGCLPELISQSIIPEISQRTGVPVLTLSIDEQTGIANNLTRIEAFVDLLKSNKAKNKKLMA